MSILAVMCILAGTGLVTSVYLLGTRRCAGADEDRIISRFPQRKIPVHSGVFRCM